MLTLLSQIISFISYFFIVIKISIVHNLLFLIFSLINQLIFFHLYYLFMLKLYEIVQNKKKNTFYFSNKLEL